MVTLAVRTFGQKPVTCNSRPLLNAAASALDRHDFIGAGVRLREALRMFLHAECDYWGCLPPKKAQQSPRTLAKALKKAGELTADLFNWVVEIIELGNKAAHLVYVRPGELSTALLLMHSLLDGSPYLIQPKGEGRRV